MALPIDVRDVMKASGRFVEERGAAVHVTIAVDPAAPDALTSAIRVAFQPQTAQGRIHVAVLGVDAAEVPPTSDVVVVVSGRRGVEEQYVSAALAQSVPTVVVSLGTEVLPWAPVADQIAEATPSAAVDGLAEWLVKNVERMSLPLAANFTFVRKAVALESVRATAFQNAVVGGVLIIPGADMPVMTANQAKMLLQIAAAYGEPLGIERVKELAAVVGGAFAFRTIARQAIGLIPALGWVIKAAIGYSGTLAMGHAAVEYFESGGDFKGMTAQAMKARDSVVQRVRAARGDRARAKEVKRLEAEAVREARDVKPLGLPAVDISPDPDVEE